MRYTFKPVKHSLIFFIVLGLVFSLIVILLPRKTEGLIFKTSLAVTKGEDQKALECDLLVERSCQCKTASRFIV